MISPEAVLRDFMYEMNAWEQRCAARTKQCLSGDMSFDQAVHIGVSEYTNIYQRYCSRLRGSPRDFYYTEPPDYDPHAEVITNVSEESPGLVQIQTQQTFGHQKRHIFMLALEDGEWRLFERKILMDSGQILDSNL